MHTKGVQTLALLTILSLTTLVGCGSTRSDDTSRLPPVDDSATNRPVSKTQTSPGMSTKQKVVMLAGAAALYYMYKKNQSTHSTGSSTNEPQYYLSKNGRVYFREKGGRVHWVTPPAEGIAVPASEASQYEPFQGYGGRTSGKDLTGIASD